MLAQRTAAFWTKGREMAVEERSKELPMRSEEAIVGRSKRNN